MTLLLRVSYHFVHLLWSCEVTQRGVTKQEESRPGFKKTKPVYLLHCLTAELHSVQADASQHTEKQNPAHRILFCAALGVSLLTAFSGVVLLRLRQSSADAVTRPV